MYYCELWSAKGATCNGNVETGIVKYRDYRPPIRHSWRQFMEEWTAPPCRWKWWFSGHEEKGSNTRRDEGKRYIVEGPGPPSTDPRSRCPNGFDFRFERDPAVFSAMTFCDEPSVDWLLAIGVSLKQAAPVAKFTGYKWFSSLGSYVDPSALLTGRRRLIFIIWYFYIIFFFILLHYIY